MPEQLNLANMRPLLTTNEAASFLGFSPRTLEKWRVVGGGPLYRVIRGRRVRYAIEDLDSFTGDVRRSTSDPGHVDGL
jgi:excisionase family DNA binding protein